MYKEPTIVDQQLEEFSEKWIEATEKEDGRVIRVRSKKEADKEFANVFFNYLLSPESIPSDIAFCFETAFTGKETFGKALLDELAEIIRDWNTSEKGAGIEYEPVDWEPDYTPVSKKNTAALFISNVNRLAAALRLPEGTPLTAVLVFPTGKKREATQWLTDAMEAGIDPQVRIAVYDSEEAPLFDRLPVHPAGQVVTVDTKVDADNIIRQLAASGDPDDPATPYRYSMVCLMEAINKKDKSEIKKHGNECVRIATENIAKNPYWLSQLVGLYLMLSNAWLALDNKERVFENADNAVSVSIMGEEQLDKETYYRQQGQAFLYRGSLYCMEKQWEEAVEDFRIAEEAYEGCRDYTLQAEALRMEGYAADKQWDGDPATPLAKGARLARLIPAETIEASSYTMLVKQLMDTNYRAQISDEELDELLVPLWGDMWRDELKRVSRQHLMEEPSPVNS